MPHLYGLGYPRQPPQSYPGRANFLIYFFTCMPFSGILRFCLARQTNSIRLNAAWAINISWLVFTLKLSTIKISRAIDNTAVTKEYKQDVYCYLNFFPAVRHFAEYVNRPGRRRVGRCQISYKRSVNLSRGKVCLGY